MYKQLIQEFPNPMVGINNSGKIEIVNSLAIALFGYTEEELIGEPIEIFLPENLIVRHVNYRNTYMKEPTAGAMGGRMDLYGRKKSGEQFPVSVNLIPLSSDEENIIVVEILDLSEQKALEERQRNLVEVLKNFNNELKQVVYITSHDLREPLITSRRFLEILFEKAQDRLDEEEKSILLKVNKLLSRLSQMVYDLLIHCRIGSEIKEPEDVDMALIIRQSIEDLSSTIESSGAKITIEGDFPIVKGFQTDLQLLVENLLTNAIKFSSKQRNTSEICIKCTKGDGEWIFSVKDNGIGVEKKFHSRIFEMFQRLNPLGEYSGNGIGLAHCKKVVDLHKGRIWIESDLGKGTTIFFSLAKKFIPINLLLEKVK